MNAYDYYAVAYDTEHWCKTCLPDEAYGLLTDKKQRDANPDAEVPAPIFACAEMDYYPVCTHCKQIHDYVTLTKEGRTNERICDKCDDQQEVGKAPIEFEGKRLCRTCKADILEDRIDEILTDVSNGWVDLGSDKNYRAHGGKWMQREGDHVTIVHLTESDGGGDDYQNYLWVGEGYLDTLHPEFILDIVRFAGLTLREDEPGFCNGEGESVSYPVVEIILFSGICNYGGLDFVEALHTTDDKVHDDLLRILKQYTPRKETPDDGQTL